MRTSRRAAPVYLLPALLALFSIAASAEEPPFESDHGTEATEWFYARRQSPPGVDAYAARQQALTSAARVAGVPWQSSSASGFHPLGITGPIPGLTWTFPVAPPLQQSIYGWGSNSLRVNTIAVHPTNPNTVFIGTSFGGLARSFDGGTTWSYVSDSLPSQEITHIVIDTTNPNIIYAGTGDPYYSGNGRTLFGAGIYRSTDGGLTWSQLGQATLGGMVVERLAIDPLTSGSAVATTLYAAVSTGGFRGAAISPGTGGGIYKSLNSGQTWALANPPGSASCWDVAPDVGFAGLVYAACDSGVSSTTTGGARWTAIHGNPSIDKTRLALAGHTLLHTTDSSGGQVFRSPNGGLLWSTFTITNFCTGSGGANQCFYDQYIAVDPGNSNHIFLGGVDAFVSSDGGNTFTDYAPFPNGPLHSDHHAIAFAPSNPSIIYEGNDGGVYKSVNGGVNWSNLNGGLPGALINGIGVSADGHMVMGAQDNSSNYFSGSGSWTEWGPGGDGGFAKIDPNNSKYLISSYVVGSLAIPAMTIYRSNNGGQTYFDITPSDARTLTQESSLFYPTIWMNQQNSSNVIVGFQNVWESYNAFTTAATYTTIGAPGRSPDGYAISTVAQAPSNPDVLYAGTTSFAVYVTNNATQQFRATWTQTIANLHHFITGIAIDPMNAQNAYFTLSGYGGGALQHVYKTTNGGGAWTALTGVAPNTLPDAPFHDILIDQISTTSVYAASDVGVFYSPDAGNTWSNMSVGIPTGTVVTSLAMNPVTRQLVAGVYGRGAYSIVLPSSTTAASVGSSGGQVTFNPGTGQVQLTIPAGAFSQSVSVTLSTPPSYPAGQASGSMAATGIGVQVAVSGGLQPISGCTLSLTYDPAAIGALDPSRFLVARYDPIDNAWVPLPSTANPGSNTVTGVTTHFSLFQIMQGTPSGSVSSVKVFPNPFQPAKGQSVMTFTQLPQGARLHIYTLSGVFVRELDADLTGTANWDGKNRNGNNAASGVYYVFAENGGQQKTFKVAIER